MSAIEVKNVSIRYLRGDIKSIGLKELIVRKIKGTYKVQEFWADKDINFKLEKGDFLGIIGTNGAGKSTLLKAISGVMEPTKGVIHHEGKISSLLELSGGFDPYLTVRENTYLRGALLGYTRAFLNEKYDEIIDFAELEEFQDYSFKQLSSGMKSRLAFSVASLLQPDILIFLLVAYDRPFASIVFESVPELFKRLKELSSKMEFNLDSIPVGDKAIAFAIPSGLLIKNMWLVPLAELEDLAHVVMIGEQPRFRPTIKAPGRLCKDVTQRDRYDHLCLLSKGHIPYDDQFEFKGNKAAQTITIAAHNLDVLEAINLDWYGSLKYMNRTGTFLRLWQGLYSFMLSIEFPAREYKGDRYFPIAYGEVSRWGYKNDIRNQPDTWFSVIKHLLEFGLLMHFRPHPNSTNPVDIAVNKNNPYLKSVEYYTPVALTNDELLNADCEAQDYMHLKRRTSTTSRAAMEFQSGPEVPKRAYQDDRKLTKQDNFVRNLAEQMLINLQLQSAFGI